MGRFHTTVDTVCIYIIILTHAKNHTLKAKTCLRISCFIKGKRHRHKGIIQLFLNIGDNSRNIVNV